ncbi:MAG: tyrosine-type recombinase/integrase, partial [Halobacteriaceae archaeon]
WCQKNDVTNLNDLTGRALHRYRMWRREEGDIKNVTEKTQMDTLRVFIRWAENIDAVPQDLSTKIKSPSLNPGDNVSDDIVDAEHADEILDYLQRYEYASIRHVTFSLLWRAALRRGSIVALDVEDYDPDEPSLDVQHRPESNTPLKNQESGERFIGLTQEMCDILDAWITDRRPDVSDEFGRTPLIATEQGRAHPGTVQNYVYSLTKPCLTTDECPHDRKISECEAAIDNTKAFNCPSSTSPHSVRRGAITHWLSSDLPESFAVGRANVSPEVIQEHYDKRSQKRLMNQRREHLDNI